MPLLTPEQKANLKKLALRALAVIIPLVVGGVGGNVLTPPKEVEVEKLIEVPVPVEPTEFVPTQGWLRDEAAIAANLDGAKTLHFSATPAGKAVLGDEDVFLYRAVRRAAKLPDDKYPNVNQLSVGCCVGCGWKHGCDVVQATAILGGAPFEFKPSSVEVIYAGSRVEVGGGRISGDGSIGAWAKEWVQARGGLVPMEKHGEHDLTVFQPARARQWGKSGVPDALEPLAREHPVKGAALVTSAKEAKRALLQGYPIPVCSDQGFTMERDRDGFARAQGSWAHCMCIVGYRTQPRPGFLILNSWGDNAHTGPVWPPDMPKAAFWADESTVDRMLRQGDSFALSDVQGFPQRKIDWFVRATKPKRDPLDVFTRDREFALAY